MNTQNILYQISEQSKNTCDDNHYCKFCNRYFRFKDLYDQHNITCEYFYRRARDREREQDTYEQLPSANEQYKLIQFLALKVTKLEKEVVRLRSITVSKKRKVILDLLQNPNFPVPQLSFQECLKTIPLAQDDLVHIFNYDLCEGIKSCLTNYFKNNNTDQLPIRAFLQKPGTIYIWSNEHDITSNVNKWHIMSNECFDKWMNRFNHRFLQEFIKWQMLNSEHIHSSDEEKEKNIENMRKINGLGKLYEERRRYEIKKWLFSFIAKDFIDMAECEYL